MSATNSGPGTGSHVADQAELYALGALEPGERAEVDAHLASCAACARAIAEAERTVAALDEAWVEPVEPPARLGARIAASALAAQASGAVRPRGLSRGMLATAASLLVAFGAGGAAVAEHAASVRDAARESAIVATISRSHFLHVPLQPREPGIPAGKVLYDRAGTWLYVVLDGTRPCHVVVRGADGERDLGPATARGTTSTLFVRDVAHPATVSVIDASGTVVAVAHLVYLRYDRE